jgi:hypothetical protein
MRYLYYSFDVDVAGIFETKGEQPQRTLRSTKEKLASTSALLAVEARNGRWCRYRSLEWR